MCGQDLFVCLPTEFRKSVCFMVLPMVFDTLRKNSPGTLVILALMSLMQDQVSGCISRGIKAVAVTREQECQEIRVRVM